MENDTSHHLLPPVSRKFPFIFIFSTLMASLSGGRQHGEVGGHPTRAGQHRDVHPLRPPQLLQRSTLID